jgi:hypothetical protein
MGGGDWPFSNHYPPEQYLATPPALKKPAKKNDFTVGDP